MKRLSLFSLVIVLTGLAAVGVGRPGATPVAGPTAVIESMSGPEALDPALAYASPDWQMQYATCLKLVNYPDSAAPEGSVLVPEAALAMPWVSRDGLNYVFVVPPGRFHFSPSTGAGSARQGGEPVTAESFRRALLRTLSPASQSPAFQFVQMIDGVDAYRRLAATDISGIKVIGPFLIIRLTTPAPDLLARLAMPFFCAVPANAPAPSRLSLIPSAGPYYIASAGADEVVLRANPNYAGKRPHVFAEIRYRFPVSPADTELHIAAGTADYAGSGIPATSWDAVAARVGPGSPAALAGRQQLFVNPLLGTRYLALNSAAGRLFHDRPALRRAVNFAIDRAVLTRLVPGMPTDQVIPPNMPGYRDALLYPLGGADIARAAALAAPYVPATAELYTTTFASTVAMAQEIKRELALIGIRVNIHTFPFGELMSRVRTPGEPYDITTTGWIVDFNDPFQLFGTQIRGAAVNNVSHFDDPLWNARIDASHALYGAARFDSFAALDRDIMRDVAPIAPISHYIARDYFSARIGCQIFNPSYGIDIAALCLR